MKRPRHDETEKAMVLAALAENFHAEMSAELLVLWLDLLAGYPAERVRAAVRTVIENYAFKTLPPFAVIRRALDDLEGVGETALKLQAAAEWDGLLAAIARHGSHAPPEALHPTTAYAVRVMGGWSGSAGGRRTLWGSSGAISSATGWRGTEEPRSWPWGPRPCGKPWPPDGIGARGPSPWAAWWRPRLRPEAGQGPEQGGGDNDRAGSAQRPCVPGVRRSAAAR